MLLVQQQKEIAPGSYSEVQIEIPTEGMEEAFTKYFMVTTNAEEPELHNIELVMRGEIQTTIKAIPPHVQFGVIPSLRSAQRTLYIRSHFVDLADKLITAESDNPFISLSAVDCKPGLLCYSVDVSPYAPAGDLAGMLSFRFNCSECPLLRVYVRGRCLGGDLTVVPHRALLKQSEKPQEYSSRVRVESRSHKLFRILSARTSAGLKVSWEASSGPSTKYDLHITTTDQGTNANALPMLILEVDRKDQPVVMIPVVRSGTK
jgi:hypothetical protein